MVSSSDPAVSSPTSLSGGTTHAGADTFSEWGGGGGGVKARGGGGTLRGGGVIAPVGHCYVSCFAQPPPLPVGWGLPNIHIRLSQMLCMNLGSGVI